MDEKVYQHTKKVFILDAILFFAWMIGVVTGIIHLAKLLSEKLTIGEKHLKLKTGILSNNEVEVPYAKINTISVKQGLFGKMLNFGAIVIYTGNDTSGIVFNQLDNPSEIKREIQQKMNI